MLRRMIVLLAIAVLPAVAMAQPEAGRWELTLGGSGSSDNDFVDNAFSFSGSLGYFMTKDVEVALRQTLSIVDASDGDGWAASTAVAIDYHFDLDAWQPFIGWQIGYLYGDAVTDSWTTGPEVGLKYFVNPSTFVFGMVQYDILFRSADDLEDNWDDGRWVYSLGLGVQF